MLDILLPDECVLCAESIDGKNICDGCESELKYLSNINTCDLCGIPLEIDGKSQTTRCGPCLNGKYYFDSAISVFLYEGRLRKLVQLFKYQNLYQLGRLLAQYMKDEVINIFGDNTLLVPVPLHINKLRIRRYNQSAVICRELSDITRCKCELFSLKKTSNNTPQVEIKDFKGRAKNVRNTYCVEREEQIYGKDIVLVDDVFTSGSTVNECSRVLLDSGVKSVMVITVARSVYI